MSEFTDCQWQSRDGLTLHYRDYPGRSAKANRRPPVLCLPGLTRNARDFESLAAALAGDWRVLCVDFRGRGDSDYAKDSASYNPLQYAEDVGELLVQTGIEKAVSIGTSLGGLVTMILAMTGAERLAGVVLNDVGPEVDPAGLARIRGYVGQGRSFPTWMHAARALEENAAVAFPEFTVGDWLIMAKRCMVLGSNGRIAFDYDMKIAEPFSRPGGEAGVDLWPGFEALGGRPVLALRGELSDILSAQTLTAMAKRIKGLESVTIPRVGHAPTLDEPESRAAILRLLARVG
jgi:pimeloyl-ACP methyl ester carboxylesterase